MPFLPFNLTNLFMASPAHWSGEVRRGCPPDRHRRPKERAAQAWTAFAADPSGFRGPFA